MVCEKVINNRYAAWRQRRGGGDSKKIKKDM